MHRYVHIALANIFAFLPWELEYPLFDIQHYYFDSREIKYVASDDDKLNSVACYFYNYVWCSVFIDFTSTFNFTL